MVPMISAWTVISTLPLSRPSKCSESANPARVAATMSSSTPNATRRPNTGCTISHRDQAHTKAVQDDCEPQAGTSLQAAAGQAGAVQHGMQDQSRQRQQDAEHVECPRCALNGMFKQAGHEVARHDQDQCRVSKHRECFRHQEKTYDQHQQDHHGLLHRAGNPAAPSQPVVQQGACKQG